MYILMGFNCILVYAKMGIALAPRKRTHILFLTFMLLCLVLHFFGGPSFGFGFVRRNGGCFGASRKSTAFGGGDGGGGSGRGGRTAAAAAAAATCFATRTA